MSKIFTFLSLLCYKIFTNELILTKKVDLLSKMGLTAEQKWQLACVSTNRKDAIANKMALQKSQDTILKGNYFTPTLLGPDITE